MVEVTSESVGDHVYFNPLVFFFVRGTHEYDDDYRTLFTRLR